MLLLLFFFLSFFAPKKTNQKKKIPSNKEQTNAAAHFTNTINIYIIFISYLFIIRNISILNSWFLNADFVNMLCVCVAGECVFMYVCVNEGETNMLNWNINSRVSESRPLLIGIICSVVSFVYRSLFSSTLTIFSLSGMEKTARVRSRATRSKQNK